jgi:hypothetical protein
MDDRFSFMIWYSSLPAGDGVSLSSPSPSPRSSEVGGSADMCEEGRAVSVGRVVEVVSDSGMGMDDGRRVGTDDVLEGLRRAVSRPSTEPLMVDCTKSSSGVDSMTVMAV